MTVINSIKLQIPQTLWSNMIRELKARGKGLKESGAFLFAKENSNVVSEFKCFDDFDPNCLTGWIEFSSEGYVKLWDYCRERQIRVIADIHTHPYANTNQSKLDINNPMIAKRGHIAFIVPCYAQNYGQLLEGVGVYEYQSGFKWKRMKTTSIKIEKKYSEDNVSRIAGFIIERNPDLANKGVEGYEEAVKKLGQLKLGLKCGSEIRTSQALQAAIITSINTGKRAFHGGVKVRIDDSVPLLIQWPGANTLNEVIKSLGAELSAKEYVDVSFTLTFGIPAERENSLQIVCNGWQGGVVQFGKFIKLDSASDFSLGGILAGSLGTCMAFLKVTGEKPDVCYKTCGLSLWRPDLDWLNPEAFGPKVELLPSKYWLVGLGHLGQAFSWCIGLLPFKDHSKVSVMLQDYDYVSESNFDTGLLTELDVIDRRKTRVCSEWFEARGILTQIIEKAFSKKDQPEGFEPKILIRGLDSNRSRREINLNGFDLVIDCGIGGTKSNFDSISIKILEAGKDNSEEIWDEQEVVINNKAIEKAMNFMGCGHYGKAISTSFVGAFSSAIVIGELIRSLNQGLKCKIIEIAMRNISDETFVKNDGNYQTETVNNGFTSIKD